MEYINIGKIITTHGLKGEIKVKSDFKYKNDAFKINNTLFIGDNYESHKIINKRISTTDNYDMLILSDIDDIGKAIKYKQKSIYVLKSDLKLSNELYLDSDLIGLSCIYNDKKLGIINNIVDQGHGNLTFLLSNGKYIPYNNNFIIKVDLENKQIIFKNLEGLL